MTKKIFVSILSISCIAVAAAIVLLTLLNYTATTDSAADDLREDCIMIASAVEMNGGRYLDETDFGDLRVTWITRGGRVIFDSAKDPTSLDDHSGREEVAEAIKSGEGRSKRYSDTLMTTTLNHAHKLSDGSVIRVSDAQKSFPAQLLKSLQPLLAVLAVLILFSMISATLISRHIVQPINNIDLDHPKTEKSYKELAPLLRKLRKQNGKVNRQMIELRQKREQFDIISLCHNEEFRRCIQNAMGGMRAECLLSTEGGERKVIASPANNCGSVTGFVAFILDVTEQQKLETMRREFTSNVSHELKTPLTTIYGIADMLANDMVKTEDVARFGGDIRSESERLINLINDIVSLSKLDENTAPRQDEEVDVYELAEEVISRLELNAKEKNVTASLCGDHVKVSGSRTVLSEIIYNLCDNAIKYNVSGGSYTVKVSHIPTKALITVSDTGTGIPADHIDRIFERFYRVDKSRSRKIKGTGLGLSIVKHGVGYHNGIVRVSSEPGKGTRFIVELPVDGAAAKGHAKISE